ncbi:hypothetical protein QQS21_000652 [Conoideocrella luteorostrata]|uniref:Uncharacterized protein n=1 Tax=Conoideocrella luteorostrata TaxID=1105319 RepID=A0AAJ0D111_9HYPO|nr:hypothetical protein QQS21_000652 [Conoideocrella luteorostrata]
MDKVLASIGLSNGKDNHLKSDIFESTAVERSGHIRLVNDLLMAEHRFSEVAYLRLLMFDRLLRAAEKEAPLTDHVLLKACRRLLMLEYGLLTTGHDFLMAAHRLLAPAVLYNEPHSLQCSLMHSRCIYLCSVAAGFYLHYLKKVLLIDHCLWRADHDLLRADHDLLRADHDPLRADHDLLRADHDLLMIEHTSLVAVLDKSIFHHGSP